MEGFLCRCVVVGQGGYGPVFQVDGLFVSVNLRCQCDALRDALKVLYGTSEVYSSHRLYHNGQLCALSRSRQKKAFLVLHAVYLAHIFAIDIHLCEVVRIVDVQDGVCCYGRQCCLIHH